MRLFFRFFHWTLDFTSEGGFRTHRLNKLIQREYQMKCKYMLKVTSNAENYVNIIFLHPERTMCTMVEMYEVPGRTKHAVIDVSFDQKHLHFSRALNAIQSIVNIDCICVEGHHSICCSVHTLQLHKWMHFLAFCVGTFR